MLRSFFLDFRGHAPRTDGEGYVLLKARVKFAGGAYFRCLGTLGKALYAPPSFEVDWVRPQVFYSNYGQTAYGLNSKHSQLYLVTEYHLGIASMLYPNFE